jgi:hypothetical protein
VKILIVIFSFTFTVVAAPSPGAAVPDKAVASPSQNAPRIVFDSMVHNFGKIPAGEVVTHEFVFTNTGNARLEITDVRPGCGCTTAGTWDKIVEPGKTGKIPLQLNSAGFGGLISKSATILCNDSNSPLSLQLTGTIWKPIDVTPAMAVFNVQSDNPTSERKILKIVNNTDEAITISDVECTNKQFSVELKTVTPGKEFDLLVSLNPPFTTPNLMVPITAKTSSPKMPILTMNAYVMIQEPVIATPSQLFIPGGVLTNPLPYTVSIRSQGTNRLEVSDAKINVPGGKIQLQEVVPGRLFNLAVLLPKGFELKPGEKAEITARTSHPRFPIITVPVVQPHGIQTRELSAAQVGPVVPRVRTLSGRTPTNQPPAK